MDNDGLKALVFLLVRQGKLNLPTCDAKFCDRLATIEGGYHGDDFTYFRCGDHADELHHFHDLEDIDLILKLEKEMSPAPVLTDYLGGPIESR